MLSKEDFREGEYVIYIDGESIELGKIQLLADTGAFIYYSSGNTAFKTPYDYLHKLANSYTILETSLGGVSE